MDNSMMRKKLAEISTATGWDISDFDRPVAEHEGYNFGERIQVIEDDESRGLYSGDEGYLVMSEVGAAQYNNLRIAMHILVDDTDEIGSEIRITDFGAYVEVIG